MKNSFTLKDIQDSLPSFTGTDTLDVRVWVKEFEDNALTLGWTELQKYVYRKQLLKGAAKLFLRSQEGISDWNSLKSTIIDEFGTNLSALDFHRMLQNRRKRYNESFKEYLYKLIQQIFISTIFIATM